MELIKADKSTYPTLKSLYLEAFPPEERAPFRWIRRRAEQGRGEFWCLTEQNACVGMAYVIRRQDLAYLYYFAVDAACRGKGLGTQALQALIRKYADCRFFLALETLDPEADNYSLRVRRHAFYQRCGLKDYPFRIQEASVVFAAMGTGGPIQPWEYNAMIDRFMGRIRSMYITMRAFE